MLAFAPSKVISYRRLHALSTSPGNPSTRSPPTEFVLGGGWKFHRNVDFFGNDLRGPTYPVSSAYENLQHIRDIAREAQSSRFRKSAVAFLPIGCIKRNLDGQRIDTSSVSWDKEFPVLRGIFIRDSAVPAGWLFFPGMDSNGNDIVQASSLPYDDSKMCALLQLAGQHNAPAFNTHGWVKAFLRPHAELELWNTNNNLIDGLYVRI